MEAKKMMPELDVQQPSSPERLLPARMLNEFSYCPRLFYLEWVQGEFLDNAETIEGRLRHHRVDQKEIAIKGPESGEEIHARSVSLSDEALGITAKLDLVEAEGSLATPVDYKRGQRPDVPEGGAWEPERVQLCAQGLLLRANGYKSEKGILYFVGSKQRVEVSFTEELISRTLALRDEAIKASQKEVPPPPLVNSPKCNRCSLAPLCLPDEINLVRGVRQETPRRLLPSREDAMPMIVQQQGATVGVEGDCLVVRQQREKICEQRLMDVSTLSVFGSVQVTTQALKALSEREIPVCFFSYGGWFYGLMEGNYHKNVLLRRAQYRASDDPQKSLCIAQRVVTTKIQNQRTLLRRNHPALPQKVLEDLSSLQEKASQAQSLETLLGIEGNAARLYFEQFGAMLKSEGGDAFSFDGRNRRPPKDPVNAMLSLLYAMLTRELTVITQKVGFDPMMGFYHQPHYGRPALALDLMEEFRPLIVDSVVLSAINNGVVKPEHFLKGSPGVALTQKGRAALLECYGRRLEEQVTHPVFSYRISYRRILEVQTRLLSRYLLGEIESFPGFKTR